MPIGAIGAIAGIGSALIGASSAKKAANAQTAAANNDIAFQKETRDQIIAKMQPYYEGGTAANAALLYEMGLGPQPMIGGNQLVVEEVPGSTSMPGSAIADRLYGSNPLASFAFNRSRTGGQVGSQFRVGDKMFASRAEAEAYAKANSTQGTPFQGFQASPGYQFAFDQGTAAVNALAGAKGGLNSGRTMQDLTTFGQGIANQEYGNWWNRLSGLAGSGQNAAASQGTAMSGAAANISGALGAIGNAQAAGSIGVANAINGGIQNYLGYQQYQNGLNSGLRNGIGTPGTTVGLFGGGR